MNAITLINLAFASYLVAMQGMQTLLLGLAFLEILQRRSTRLPELDGSVLASPNTPPITILAPAYNEGANIENSVRAFLQVEYPSLTLVVINDGSKDDTFAILKERFALVPSDLVVRNALPTRPIRGLYRSLLDDRLIVVDKQNGGKADALNVGLNVARAPLVCCVDADTVIDRNALLRMVEPYLFDSDVIAVGGTVVPANGCGVRDGIVESVALPRSWLARFQIVEYLRAFVFARMGLNRMGGNIIISGAFGLFLREVVVGAGGYKTTTVGEDIELVVRLHRRMREQRRPYRVLHLSEARCFTEAPETMAVLSKQRDRWQRGLMETIVCHRGMIFNPRHRMLGMVILPAFILFEMLGPLIELGGYVWFAWAFFTQPTDRWLIGLFCLATFLWGLLLSVQSVLLETIDAPDARPLGQKLALMWVAAFEGIGYRQLTLWFRLRGVWKYLVGDRSWGEMTRRGIGQPKPTSCE